MKNKTDGKSNLIILGNKSYSVCNSAVRSPGKKITPNINNHLLSYTIFRTGFKNIKKESGINFRMTPETPKMSSTNKNLVDSKNFKNFIPYTENSTPTNRQASSHRETYISTDLNRNPFLKSKPLTHRNLGSSLKSIDDKNINRSRCITNKKTRNERSNLSLVLNNQLKFSNNSLFAESRNKLYLNMETHSQFGISKNMKTFNSTKAVNKIEEQPFNMSKKRTVSNDSTRKTGYIYSSIDTYVNILSTKFKKYDNAKYGTKVSGCIIGYGVNTSQGLVRNYNEDRVSIILNVVKPNSRKHEEWPKVSFFGIYDGHGGNKCADFLKANLHQFIFSEKYFPEDPAKAILKGFEEAEKKFILDNKPVNLINEFNRSGSCAIVLVILDDVCYAANLGDSRGLISENGGEKISLLSKDHKPNDPDEKKRIYAAGGYIYQGAFPQANGGTNNHINIVNPIPSLRLNEGPWRIMPGKLSVSRAFGDLEAKIPELGGNPKVLSSTPQIISFKINELTDFMVLGSDGIFDKLSNLEVVKCIWSSASKELLAENIHKHCGRVVDLVMKNSLHNNTLDNITCVFICFENFKNILFDNYNEEFVENKIIKKFNATYITNYTLKLDENLNFKNKNIKNLKRYSGGSELKTQNDSDISDDENGLRENDDDNSDLYQISKNNKAKKTNIAIKSYNNLASFNITVSSKLAKFDNLSKDIKFSDNKLSSIKEKTIMNLNRSNDDPNHNQNVISNNLVISKASSNNSLINYNSLTNKGLYLTSKSKK